MLARLTFRQYYALLIASNGKLDYYDPSRQSLEKRGLIDRNGKLTEKGQFNVDYYGKKEVQE